MDELYLFGAFAALIAFAIVTGMIGAQRTGSGGAWMLAGFCLGPLALILALLSGEPCQICRKPIHPEARKCPYCQSETGK